MTDEKTQKEVDVVRPDAVATIPGPDLNPHTPKRQGPAGSVDIMFTYSVNQTKYR